MLLSVWGKEKHFLIAGDSANLDTVELSMVVSQETRNQFTSKLSYTTLPGYISLMAMKRHRKQSNS